MDWKRLLEFDYWFEGVIGADSNLTAPIVLKDSFAFWTFLSIFSFFTIIGIVLRVFRVFLSSKHPFQKKFVTWSNHFTTLGLIGLTWFLLRETSIAFLGGRFWLLFMIGYLGYIIYSITRYFIEFYKMEITYFRQTFEKK